MMDECGAGGEAQEEVSGDEVGWGVTYGNTCGQDLTDVVERVLDSHVSSSTSVGGDLSEVRLGSSSRSGRTESGCKEYQRMSGLAAIHCWRRGTY